MDRRLIDYLPPVLREVLEFQAINAANEPEISQAWEALDALMDNQFLDSADGRGVAAWEGELGLRPKNTDSLEGRKARIRAMWNLELPYTVGWMKEWLTGLCGSTGHVEWVEDYTIHIQLNYHALPDAASLAPEISALLLAVRPCNMRVVVSEHWYFPAAAHVGLASREGERFILRQENKQWPRYAVAAFEGLSPREGERFILRQEETPQS